MACFTADGWGSHRQGKCELDLAARVPVQYRCGMRRSPLKKFCQALPVTATADRKSLHLDILQEFSTEQDFGMAQGISAVAVTSGANMNFDRLRLVTELAGIGALKEAMLATTMPERQGSFKDFLDIALDNSDLQITEFKYRCTSQGTMCSGLETRLCGHACIFLNTAPSMYMSITACPYSDDTVMLISMLVAGIEVGCQMMGHSKSLTEHQTIIACKESKHCKQLALAGKQMLPGQAHNPRVLLLHWCP